jgi:alkylhydroperoxidase family enzyme
MPRIEPVDYEKATPEARELHDGVIRELGRMTNMKRTLLHSSPAFRALMEWYPLRAAVVPFLGERLTDLFTHAISAENDCLVCSTYFRRALIEAGESPDNFVANPREATVLEFARALAAPGGWVSADLYARLSKDYTAEQVVTLTAFGAMMVATNVFNNALEVELDDYLKVYQVGTAAAPTEGAT